MVLRDTIRRGVHATLAREGSLESIRYSHFPSKPSRMRGIYAYPSRDAARIPNRGIGQYREDNLFEIIPADTRYVRSIHDGAWIDDFDALGEPEKTAFKYWDSESSLRAHPELLLTGTFRVVGEAFRWRALEVIRKAWPESLYFLELGRAAAFLGESYGYISPFLKLDADGVYIRHIMKCVRSEEVGLILNARALSRFGPPFSFNWSNLLPTPSDGGYLIDLPVRLPDTKCADHVFRPESWTLFRDAFERISRTRTR